MKTLLSIVGARPQFVKLAPFSRAARAVFEEVVVHTGQHFDDEMSGKFFEELEIPRPDHNLGINGGKHGDQTGRMLTGLEHLLEQVGPDIVVVFGDTNTTLAGALAAAKMNIRSVHIEAGLRSFNRSMPEEINRVVADHTCDLLFAPTRSAMDHLSREGLGHRSVLTGDIMVDSLAFGLEKAGSRPGLFTSLNIEPGKYYLLTLHRPYNVDDPENLAGLLKQLANLDHPVLFPVHPRTRDILYRYGIGPFDNIRLTAPLGYLDFLVLQQHAVRIITDSGGIQKEAYIIGTPCITVRPETEWVETVEAGWNLLLDWRLPDFLQRIAAFHPRGERAAIFGSDVARKMVEQLQEKF